MGEADRLSVVVVVGWVAAVVEGTVLVEVAVASGGGAFVGHPARTIVAIRMMTAGRRTDRTVAIRLLAVNGFS